MKICYIAPLYDPWLLGGAEKYVSILAKELSKNHSVLVITGVGKKERTQEQLGENPKIIEIKSNNITTLYEMLTKDYSISSAKKLLWHFFDLWNISMYFKIKKVLKNERPDLVHTNGIKGFSSSIFSAIKHTSIPHVHTIHDYELISRWFGLFRNKKPISNFNMLDWIHIFYQRRMSAKIDAVISPSKFTMQLHEKLGFFNESKKHIIPNGIKLNSNSKPKSTLSNEFLFVGQITENKGPQIAVSAFKKIKSDDSKLHIVGQGPYLNSLKKLVKDDKRIIVHEYLKDEVLQRLYEKCSYFVLPSIWYENCPLVINEAMNQGLPVIASNIGGVPELIQDGYNGFLTEAGSPNSLTKTFEKLLTNEKILYKLSNNAINSSRNNSLDQQIEHTLDVYSSVLSNDF